MARTLDHAAYAVRRDVFLDSAQRLIQLKGYEQVSVQDVLVAAGTSKGAFYHYFASKADLLDGVIERMVDQAWKAVEPVVDDASLTAPQKIHAVFATIAAFKAARKELLLAVIGVWMSDENAIVREKFRRGVALRLTPLLARIIRQGVREDTFTATSPEGAAHVLVALLLGLNQTATDLFLRRQANAITFEEVEPIFAAHAEAFDRVLGAAPGSHLLMDESVLREWFG